MFRALLDTHDTWAASKRLLAYSSSHAQSVVEKRQRLEISRQ
jgi:hypothetical protein